MSGNYDKFLAVLKKWPVNANKKSRDLGSHLRELLKSCNFNGNPFPGNPDENLKKIESLLRITENKYGNEYESQYKFAASGLNLQDLKLALSDEFINNKNKIFFKI